ncbi:hypothetical protein PMAYCL1PPCAC_16923, partial [Pristionchus mayeri]
CTICQIHCVDLGKHMSEKHSRLYCLPCNRVFSSPFSRVRHEKVHRASIIVDQPAEQNKEQLICNLGVYKSQADGTISVQAIKQANNSEIGCLVEILFNIHKIAFSRSERNEIVQFLPIIRYIGNHCSSSDKMMKHTSRVQPFIAVTQKEANAIEMERKLDEIILRKDIDPHVKMRLYQDRLARLINYRKDNEVKDDRSDPLVPDVSAPLVDFQSEPQEP